MIAELEVRGSCGGGSELDDLAPPSPDAHSRHDGDHVLVERAAVAR